GFESLRRNFKSFEPAPSEGDRWRGDRLPRGRRRALGSLPLGGYGRSSGLEDPRASGTAGHCLDDVLRHLHLAGTVGASESGHGRTSPPAGIRQASTRDSGSLLGRGTAAPSPCRTIPRAFRPGKLPNRSEAPGPERVAGLYQPKTDAALPEPPQREASPVSRKESRK